MKKIKSLASAIFFSALLIFTGCSSAPERSMLESGIYNSAVSLLESANSAILTGDYNKAEFLLNESYSASMSIDNYDLLTSVLLARASLSLSYNPPKTEEAKLATEQARVFAQYSDSIQKQLALCTLSDVRIAALSENTDSNTASKLLSTLENNKKAVKGDPYNEAHFDSAAGDIYKLQKNYEAAEKAYLAAVKSFTDNRYLSEIGISWYKVAQVRSLNENKKGALEALENAIYYDRLAENTLALATDYYAKSTVLLKGNPTPTEKAEAEFALQHSKDILQSVSR